MAECAKLDRRIPPDYLYRENDPRGTQDEKAQPDKTMWQKTDELNILNVAISLGVTG